MSDTPIRVLEVSKRTGACSPGGWQYAVKFVRESESGIEMMWLDDFINQHAEGVVVR